MRSPLRSLHRRLAAAMGLTALAAFISGAGLDTPSPVIAAGALVLALFWAPGPKLQRILDPIWRVLALLLTVRAGLHVVSSPDDVVLPMVDLLLLLLVSENLKESGAAGDTRVYSLSFALLVAACAYRPGVIFAVSFVTYAALATVTLMVGHFIRKLGEHNAREVKLERSFLLRVASMSGVMLALSALVFAAFPRVSRGWVARGNTPAASVVGFADRVSLAEHGGRIYPNPQIVLRVEFPETAPASMHGLYWRGRSYDFFDGVAWDRSATIPRVAPSPGYYATSWPGGRLLQRIYAVPLDIPVVFGVQPILNVSPHTRIRVLQDQVGDMWYLGGGVPTYDVVSISSKPTAEQLRNAPEGGFPGERHYLQLPPLSRRVRALADSVTANATTRYDKVIALQEWLRTFRYTLDLPTTPREATLENFLFRRRAGHCEYFSTALAMLAREVGIPTRNVNGFLGGTWNEYGKYLSVTMNEAHSWVEVYFPGYGWVPFDATPSATTDVAQQQISWFAPYRAMFDGLEHRWNKWILEYNLESQVNLFRRATEPFARKTPEGKVSWNPVLTQSLRYAFFGGLLLALLLSVFRRVRTEDVSGDSRIYLKLRRAYERAGYELKPHAPPMEFVQKLEKMNAPGSKDAKRAVELYIRARFSGSELNEEERRELRTRAAEARKAIRAA